MARFERVANPSLLSQPATPFLRYFSVVLAKGTPEMPTGLPFLRRKPSVRFGMTVGNQASPAASLCRSGCSYPYVMVSRIWYAHLNIKLIHIPLFRRAFLMERDLGKYAKPLLNNKHSSPDADACKRVFTTYDEDWGHRLFPRPLDGLVVLDPHLQEGFFGPDGTVRIRCAVAVSKPRPPPRVRRPLTPRGAAALALGAGLALGCLGTTIVNHFAVERLHRRYGELFSRLRQLRQQQQSQAKRRWPFDW